MTMKVLWVCYTHKYFPLRWPGWVRSAGGGQRGEVCSQPRQTFGCLPGEIKTQQQKKSSCLSTIPSPQISDKPCYCASVMRTTLRGRATLQVSSLEPEA